MKCEENTQTAFN